VAASFTFPDLPPRAAILDITGFSGNLGEL